MESGVDTMMGLSDDLLSACRYVAGNSRYVGIDDSAIEKFAASMNISDVVPWNFRCPVNIPTGVSGLDFIFVFNALSFCYWNNDKWSISESYDRGTWSMVASLKRAMDEGIPILDSGFLSTIQETDVEHILRGKGKLQLMSERTHILKGLSTVSLESLIQRSGSDAMKLVGLISSLPSYEDSSIYRGKKVPFAKRAQLLVHDISRLSGFTLTNTEGLVGCADYIIPMVLRYYGVLEYSGHLAEKVDNCIHIPAHSEEEIEIRANTLVAINKLSSRLGLPRMLINDYLWLKAEKIPQEVKYHRTMTTAY